MREIDEDETRRLWVIRKKRNQLAFVLAMRTKIPFHKLVKEPMVFLEQEYERTSKVYAS